MATNRLHRGLVALAASAITAVYTAGYVHTQSADATLAAPDTTAVVVPTTTQSAPVATSGVARRAPTAVQGLAPSVNTARPAATATPASTTALAPAALKDGTYSGTGTSRRGNIDVSLVIQGGRIASVNITRATTQYPTRIISGLPGEVVSRQSAQVDTISGATYSSIAFKTAVQQALQHAQA
jgi:uncharacterized protein with FMN-binding domain